MEKAIRNGSRIARKNFRTGTRASFRAGIEDDQREDDESRVERADELRVASEDLDAVVRDGARHRPEDAERRQGHDVVGQLEEDRHRRLEEADEGTGLRSDVSGGDAEERREDDDLQDVLPHHGVEDVRREEVDERLDRRLRLGERLAGRGEVQADAGFDDVGENEADDEGDRRRDLEVDERLHAHPPDGLDVARLPDPEDDRGEDEGDDEQLDQVDERPREEAERLVGPGVSLGGESVAEDDAEDQRVEDEGGRRQPAGSPPGGRPGHAGDVPRRARQAFQASRRSGRVEIRMIAMIAIEKLFLTTGMFPKK